MNYTDKITLTTKELVAALALCEYENFARNLIFKNDIISKKKKDINLIAEETEQSLREKGFWHARTKTNLSKGLEELIHALAKSLKNIHCSQPGKELYIHQIDINYSLCQLVEEEEHTFTYLENKKGFIDEMSHFYHLNVASNKVITEMQTIQVSEDVYNSLHELNSEEIDRMLNNEKENQSFQEFIDDFNKNRKVINPLTLNETDHVNGKNRIEQVAFSLPGDGMLWHLEYEEVNDHKVYFVPVSVDDYFKKIEDTIHEFFLQSLAATIPAKPASKPKRSKKTYKNKETPQPFSFKKGLSFFWKSNIVLLVMVCVLLINQGKWVGEGQEMLVFFILLFEVMIVLLSLFTCFPDKPKKSE
jgi:predicted CopG family antitoxin